MRAVSVPSPHRAGSALAAGADFHSATSAAHLLRRNHPEKGPPGADCFTLPSDPLPRAGADGIARSWPTPNPA
jgi:hypothetical protein